MKFYKILAVVALFVTPYVHASLLSISPCTGAVPGAATCTVTTSPPAIVSQDPNDGVLLAWDENQNVTLTQNLYVDRVFDNTASFVGQDSNGYYIVSGTVVSSHYVQWDPLDRRRGRVQATINTDSQIFAFLTSDQNLFDSDDALGLSGVDYNNFTLRGLESGDLINFNGNSVDIDWTASSPGDWTRMITAFSPAAVSAVPVPAAVFMFAPALLGFLGFRRKLKS
jgi:hypothetical protein